MVSILAFDSRSMKSLLKDDFSDYFSLKYPIFYQNKINKGSVLKPKYFYRNAIDSGLKNFQYRAVEVIIDYICKYQNTFISSFLFSRNLPEILSKGIPCSKLFES